jgi:hypothetical protein
MARNFKLRAIPDPGVLLLRLNRHMAQDGFFTEFRAAFESLPAIALNWPGIIDFRDWAGMLADEDWVAHMSWADSRRSHFGIPVQRAKAAYLLTTNMVAEPIAIRMIEMRGAPILVTNEVSKAWAHVTNDTMMPSEVPRFFRRGLFG